MRLNFDLIVFEADSFAETLDRTAGRIYAEVSESFKCTQQEKIEAAADWDEASTGVSLSQYEDFIYSQHVTQMRALSAAIFTLIDLQLLEFIRYVKVRFISKDRFPKVKERYGRSGDGELLRLAAEYDERCNIQLADLPGFETCREIILARNTCVHNGGYARSDYLEHTSQRFLHNDGYLILTDKSFEEGINSVKQFARELACAVSKRIRPRVSSRK